MICTELTVQDIRERPMWIAQLTNGLTVYQNDEAGNSWFFLKDYCKTNNVKIQSLQLKFRDHMENIGEGEGYIFIRSILANITGYNQHYYYTGIYHKDQSIVLTKWIIPEIIPLESEVVSVEEIEHSLIKE